MSVTSDVESAETPQYRIDWESREPVCTAIYTALDEALGRLESDIGPLANYIDPDAIESFFDGTPEERVTRSLTFEYGEYVVTVDGAGYVSID